MRRGLKIGSDSANVCSIHYSNCKHLVTSMNGLQKGFVVMFPLTFCNLENLVSLLDMAIVNCCPDRAPHISTHLHTHLTTHTSPHTSQHIHTHTHTHTHIHTHTHTHTHTPRSRTHPHTPCRQFPFNLTFAASEKGTSPFPTECSQLENRGERNL